MSRVKNIYMPEGVWDKIEEEAKKRNISVSELIRRALEGYLNGK